LPDRLDITCILSASLLNMRSMGAPPGSPLGTASLSLRLGWDRYTAKGEMPWFYSCSRNQRSERRALQSAERLIAGRKKRQGTTSFAPTTPAKSLGFTISGKTHCGPQEASGHAFIRADKRLQNHWDLRAAEKPLRAARSVRARLHSRRQRLQNHWDLRAAEKPLRAARSVRARL